MKNFFNLIYQQNPMFTKNSLTTNLKSLLLQLDVKCSKKESLTRLNVSGVSRQQIPLVAFHRGAFVVPKSNQKSYELTTHTTKKPLGKADNQKLKKYINYILSQFKRLVKGIFENVNFKPKSPCFTN